MSNTALSAVWVMNIHPPTRKLVLLFMADSLNEKTGRLNPGIPTVARGCGISADQARRHLRDLMQDGLIEVVGNHHGGAPGATNNYRLNLPSTPGMDATPCTDATPGMDAGDALHPCSIPLAPMQETAGIHASQTRKNQKEPEVNQKVARARRATPPPPDSVSAQVWADFLAIRKAKRMPLTETAMQGIAREAEKAGITLGEALTVCAEASWASFKAEWHSNRAGNAGAESFRERDRRLAAEEVAKWSPRIADRLLPGETFRERDRRSAAARMAEFAPRLAETGQPIEQPRTIFSEGIFDVPVIASD